MSCDVYDYQSEPEAGERARIIVVDFTMPANCQYGDSTRFGIKEPQQVNVHNHYKLRIVDNQLLRTVALATNSVIT